MRCAISIITLVVAGCATDLRKVTEPAPLASAAPKFDVFLNTGGELGRPTLPSAVTFAPGFEPIVADGDVNCPRLDPSFHATIDGTPVEVSLGASVWAPRLDSFRCLPGGAQFTPPEGSHPDAVLVVGDDSLTLTIPLGDDLVPRVATPAGTGDWQFTAGQALSFTWSPADDLARSSSVFVSFRNSASAAQTNIDDSFVTLTSATIDFTYPTGSVEGAGEMALGFVGSRGVPCSVDPELTCGVSTDHAVIHEATIAPALHAAH